MSDMLDYESTFSRFHLTLPLLSVALPHCCFFMYFPYFRSCVEPTTTKYIHKSTTSNVCPSAKCLSTWISARGWLDCKGLSNCMIELFIVHVLIYLRVSYWSVFNPVQSLDQSTCTLHTYIYTYIITSKNINSTNCPWCHVDPHCCFSPTTK